MAFIGTLVDGFIDWMGDFVGFITDNPLVLMFVVLGVCGIAIGFIRRLINL